MKKSVSFEDMLLVSPKDIEPSYKGWEVEGVFNPAAIRMKNGKIMLMARIAESAEQHRSKKSMTCPIMTSNSDPKPGLRSILRRNIKSRGSTGIMVLKDGTCRLPHMSHFRKIFLDESGFIVEKIDQKHAFSGIPNDGDFGVEDPRITKIGGKYYMTYVGISMNEGISTYLAESKNLINWKRLGLIFSEQNKDVVLFPEKIKGKYVALNRPESLYNFSKPGIWISYSPDLIYWGKGKNIIRPREDSWENSRNGSGAPPIKTKKGWLLIYHGVEKGKKRRVYSAGAVLLDLKNPEKIIARTPKNNPLIKPRRPYEKFGYIRNVIFPTGAVIDKDKKSVLIYSGGADSVISVRKLLIKDILDSLDYKKVN